MEVNMRMVSCDLKALCYVNVMYMKKICTKFWFLIGDFPRSPSPVRGFWKSPRAARRARGPERRPEGTACCPRGFSKSPNGRWGSGENPRSKTRILYIFFSHSCLTLIKQYEYCCYHSYFVPLKNILHQHKSLRALKEENDTSIFYFFLNKTLLFFKDTSVLLMSLLFFSIFWY